MLHDDECMDYLYQAWYLDDGALAGNRPAVLQAMCIIEETGPALAIHIIEEMGPALGLYINFAKRELFSSKGNTSFPPAVKCQTLTFLVLLLEATYTVLYRFIADKCAESKEWLTSLVDVAGVDLKVVFTLLRVCGGFCKLVHLTRVTPPSLASDDLMSFDEDVRQFFVLCSAIEVSDTAWKQAQLSLRSGGLDLWSLSCHAAATLIASLSSSGWDNPTITIFSRQSLPITPRSPHIMQSRLSLPLASPTTQREPSSKIDEDQFKSLLVASCPVNKARLLSVSASSWLSAVPSMGLGLHMESNEFQTKVRWWLGVGVGRSVCPFCQDVVTML